MLFLVLNLANSVNFSPILTSINQSGKYPIISADIVALSNFNSQNANDVYYTRFHPFISILRGDNYKHSVLK